MVVFLMVLLHGTICAFALIQGTGKDYVKGK